MLARVQQDNNAADEKIKQIENINDAQAAVIRVLRDDLQQATANVERLVAGSEVVLRGLDAIYNYTKDLYMQGRMDQDDWTEIYRFMLRADVGFAIVNGAPFVPQNEREIIDLTAESEIDEGEETELDEGEETETDEEMEVEL